MENHGRRAYRHLDSSWLLILLTTCLITLTCLQARGSTLTRSIHLVNQSRSYSLFVLRAISELTALSLSATISLMLERIKWTLVYRSGRDGMSPTRFTDLLALEESTSVLALLRLAGSPAVDWGGARVWSLIRLLFVALVPITGILIMSQVDISLAFTTEASQDAFFGFHMQSMNASMASEYIGLTDLVITAKFASFLGDPIRSVNLNPASDHDAVCALNAGMQPGDDRPSDCVRRYWVPSTAASTVPELASDSRWPRADSVLLSRHRGLLLEYDAGDSDAAFDPIHDCRTYSSRYWGNSNSAVRLCVASPSPNVVQARLVTCPGDLVLSSSCYNTTTWHTNNDWTVKLTTHLQYGALAYSRSNGSIIWHSVDYTTPATPANVSAAEILQVYDTLLFDTTTLNHKGNLSDLPYFSSSVFPTFLWASEPVFNSRNAVNPSASATAYSILQSLLAMPMILCQNGFARRLLPLAVNTMEAAVADKIAANVDTLSVMLSPLPERKSPAALAYHRYEAVVSTPTLIAYIVLSGLALLACCAVQLLSSRVLGGFKSQVMPRLSKFPAADLFLHCIIEDERRRVVYQAAHIGDGGQGEASSNDQGGELDWLSTLSVKWSQPRGAEYDRCNSLVSRPRGSSRNPEMDYR